MSSSQQHNTIPKSIPEQKLKAFSIGTMGKRTMSKRELEELRKKEQEEAAAHAFQEFVETFQESGGTGAKVWVKAGTYDAGQRKEDTKERGKIYKPQSRIAPQESLSSAERAQEYARLLAADRKPERLGKKITKHKSNLETFKEELRQIQEEREERHKYKVGVKTLETDLEPVKPCEIGSYDNGDPTTTNLYLGNLNPKITEQELMEVFGKFGPLASIKIMWPRSDEEKARGRNCGFVAFMNRKDGERALKNLNGKDVMSYEMKLGWGKSVIIPPHPIYVPPALLELSMPPRPSGLPFNAQPYAKDNQIIPRNDEELDKILFNAVVKVVIPTDRNLLMLINRMVEFVIREGPLFEAMIMNREINSPLFRFLFENQSPAHTYYRWKLFSIMHGDLQKEWRMSEFRMFMDGSIWKPPIMNVYTQGMPADLIEDDAKEPSKGSLSITQRDRLEDLIRNLSPERRKIGEAMVFCIEHSEAADEITECIYQSLSNSSTAVYKKIARFYLISDILHNCGVKINNASFYRKSFEQCLIETMKQLNACYNNLTGRLKAEGFKLRVFKVLKAWEDAVIYTRDFLNKLHNAFLGLEDTETDSEVENDPRIEGIPIDDDDLDCPMDGATLLKGILNRSDENISKNNRDILGDTLSPSNSHENLSNNNRLILSSGNRVSLSGNTETVRERNREKLNENSPTSLISHDLDGIPISNEFFDQIADKSNAPSGFIPSKWETIDPDQVFAQAMTTSKWDQIENCALDDQSTSSPTQNELQDSNETENSRNLTEERRVKLREIELKILQYQDELESGVKVLKTGWSVAQQVEHYRRKLLRRSEKEKSKQKELKNLDRTKKDWAERSTWRSSSPEEYYKELLTSRRAKKRSRSSSDSSPEQREHERDHDRDRARNRTRSKSPVIRKSHHSRSPAGKRTSRAPSPPTPPRIKRFSPTSSKYSPTTKIKSRSSRYRAEAISPARSSSKYGSGRSSSPSASGRYSAQSPEVQKKHRHKHKY